MRHFFQAHKGKKAAAALERVQRPKNTAQQFFVLRCGFKAHQIGVELVEYLLRLQQKFIQDMGGVKHGQVARTAGRLGVKRGYASA